MLIAAKHEEVSEDSAGLDTALPRRRCRRALPSPLHALPSIRLRALWLCRRCTPLCLTLPTLPTTVLWWAAHALLPVVPALIAHHLSNCFSTWMPASFLPAACSHCVFPVQPTHAATSALAPCSLATCCAWRQSFWTACPFASTPPPPTLSCQCTSRRWLCSPALVPWPAT